MKAKRCINPMKKVLPIFIFMFIAIAISALLGFNFGGFGNSEIVANALIGPITLNANETQISTLVKNDTTEYQFPCLSTGEYNFKIGYTAMPAVFIVNIYYNSIPVPYDEITLPSDALGQRYGVSFDADSGQTYSIYVEYTNIPDTTLSVGVMISKPLIFDTIKIKDTSTDIYMDLTPDTNNTHLILGKEYEFSLTYENNLTPPTGDAWRLNAYSNPNLVNISKPKITIVANAQNEDQSITFDFIDDENCYSITFILKLPCYPKANFDNNTYDYSIKLYDSYDVELSASLQSQYFQRMNITMGGYPFNNITTTLYNLIQVPILSQTTTITSTVTMNVNNFEFTKSVSSKSVTNYLINLVDYNSETVTGDNKRVIISNGGAISQNFNKTINISSTVTTIFFVSEASKTYENLRFVVKNTGGCYFYMNNVTLKSSNDTSANTYFFESKASASTIDIYGTNRIYGKTLLTGALFKANSIQFKGTGSLSIIGDNGTDGNPGANQPAKTGSGETGNKGGDGTPGTNGYNAVNCTALSKTGTPTVTLQGGNGGNGGNGGYGGKGGPGAASDTHDPARATKGGIGGEGGIGGNGGNAGIGCNKTLSSITITNGFAGRGGNGGKGGDGGNGANGVVISVSTNYTTLAPSEGGNGGNGGNAGTSGTGTINGTSYPTGGAGGNGGTGGNGAAITFSNGGLSSLYSYVDARNGGNGGRGGDGYIGGKGGAGGDGGVGAKGQDGSVFIRVEDGHTGGNGGIGGNGGNSFSSSSNVGGGGDGSDGGAGGAPGTPINPNNAANQGPNGLPGASGNPGVYVNPNPSCVAEGTLITLSDGSRIAVENLIGNESLLVWNLFTGTFDVAPILFIDSDPYTEYEIIHLYFSDGTEVKVISEHGFWDLDLNEYVFLRNDAAQYIGHWFNKQTDDGNGGMTWTAVQLIDVDIYSEDTTAWSPVTFGHLCYYVNGILSMPGATEGLINIFEVDATSMYYDTNAFAADIETYGLFTYEEFAEIILVPEVVFEAFNGQYLKVSIGKGLIGLNDLITLVERYSEFFSI